MHSRFWTCGALLLICGAADAQQSRIAKPIDNAQRATLAGHLHPKATAANDRGRVAPSLKLSYVTLTLTQSDAQKADLRNLLAEQQNPSSPNYHRWLTPSQYADRFGVSPEDMNQITQWLRGQGLTIAGVAQGRNWIAVDGSAAQIESAFATEIHQYAVDGETHFANATNPSVPAAIGGLVLSIRGLNDFRMKPRIQRPKGTSAHGNIFMGPNDFATIYDVLPAYSAGIDGSGQRIVVAGDSDVDLTDIQQFQIDFDLPINPPKTLLVGKDPGTNGDLGEADIDLEWSGAVARNATITYVYAIDVMNAVNYAIDRDLAPVISLSFGSCEPANGQAETLTFQAWAQKANLEGITWFNASGDDGAADCSDDKDASPEAQIGLAVDTPASVPEITGIGGTEFNEGSGTYWTTGSNASALSYIPETSWNGSPGYGSPDAGGGGASIYFPKPSWQVVPGVPGNNARNIPDVAFNASPDHDPYPVDSGGNRLYYGGTSCPTPAMAGIAALLNQYLGSGGLGNINPQLYSLAQSNPDIFHDVQTGNNIVTAQCAGHDNCPTPTPVGYSAGVGYDNVTGLGSVDAWKLMTCWSGTCTATTPAPAASSLSLVGNVSSVGQQDTAFLTATATANDGVSTPVGLVSFSAGNGAPLGSVTLVGSAGISTATLVVTGAELPTGTTTVTATYDGSSTSAAVTSSVTLNVRAIGSSSNGVPEIPANGLTDGAAFQRMYSPGMIMSVFGATLSPAGTAESASSVPLPVTMAGVAATVNGVEAPLYYVSPTQLNIQVPWQTAEGPAMLTVNNNGKIASQSFNVTPASPGIFTDQNKNIVPNNTAPHGQITTLYLAGAGPVTPAIATGSAPVTSTPITSLPAPQDTTVTVAGVQAATSFIGIPYALVGVTQINFQIPGGIPTGLQPVVVKVGGIASIAAYINVTN